MRCYAIGEEAKNLFYSIYNKYKHGSYNFSLNKVCEEYVLLT